VSSSLRTLAFMATTFSSAILRSFCFLGLTFELTCSQCSMTSQLTPTRLEVDHENTSQFLSRKLRISACSCLLTSVLINTILSMTLGFSDTFLNSPSTSMAFLHSDGGWVSYCSDYSHRKCTFCGLGRSPFQCFWLLTDCRKRI
jgi:hypothetical protein